MKTQKKEEYRIDIDKLIKDVEWQNRLNKDKKEVTKVTLAKEAGVTKQTILNMQNKVSDSVVAVYKLAKLAGKTVEDILIKNNEDVRAKD